MPMSPSESPVRSSVTERMSQRSPPHPSVRSQRTVTWISTTLREIGIIDGALTDGLFREETPLIPLSLLPLKLRKSIDARQFHAKINFGSPCDPRFTLL